MAVRSSEMMAKYQFVAHRVVLDEGTHGSREVRHCIGYALGMWSGYSLVVDCGW